MIGIVDYGSGNIEAIRNIYKNLNIDTKIVRKADDLAKVSKIVLPGVGAFDSAMSQLNESGLRSALDEAVLRKKTPVLGICVGMQIMANSSEEGSLEGLGWVAGAVKRFDAEKIVTLPKLPHMGWNEISRSNHELLKSIDYSLGFYFLHSYYFDSKFKQNVIARAFYSHDFDCAVSVGHIHGVQFHPEKSHQNGIQVFKNFSDLSLC
jgi:imidazole glycerol-phosphate synthase subunit HisH